MIGLILMVFAFVCFTLAAAGVSSSKINLIGAGLAFWTLSIILGNRVP